MISRWVLGGACVAVLGMAVYLLVEVRAKPAQAQVQRDKRDREEIDREIDPPIAAKRPVTSTGSASSTPAPAVAPPTAPTAPTAPAAPTPTAPGSGSSDGDDKEKPFRLDALMAEANRAYDSLDFDEARTIAQRILKREPKNVRMLRILVSIACQEADQAEAQRHFNLLPPRDREQMKTRCIRYNVQFTDPPTN